MSLDSLMIRSANLLGAPLKDAAGKKLGTGLIGLAVSDLQKGKPPETVMDGMRDFVLREEEKKETEET